MRSPLVTHVISIFLPLPYFIPLLYIYKTACLSPSPQISGSSGGDLTNGPGCCTIHDISSMLCHLKLTCQVSRRPMASNHLHVIHCIAERYLQIQHCYVAASPLTSRSLLNDFKATLQKWRAWTGLTVIKNR